MLRDFWNWRRKRDWRKIVRRLKRELYIANKDAQEIESINEWLEKHQP